MGIATKDLWTLALGAEDIDSRYMLFGEALPA
jgi:hypothetical protein